MVTHQVALVPDEYPWHCRPRSGRRRELLDLLDPLRQVGEALLARQIEDEDDPVGVAVAGGEHGAVALLAARVPNLVAGGKEKKMHLTDFWNILWNLRQRRSNTSFMNEDYSPSSASKL